MKTNAIRKKRAKSIRSRMRRQSSRAHRLCVYRTNNHVYAQVIDDDNAKVVVSASTVEKLLKGKLKHTGNKEAAAAVGTLIAERAVDKGVKEINFDRSGYAYHGVIVALATAARDGGLDF